MSDKGTRLESDLHPPAALDNDLVPWGDPEAASAVAASRAMAPIVGPYLKDVLTGEMARRSLEDLHVPYDPKKSFRENVLDPKAIEKAQEVAMGFSGGGLSFKPAPARGPLPPLWHGASRELEGGRFDPKRLKSGEGWHGEGFGGYVSEKRKVAEWYRNEYGQYDQLHEDFAQDILSEVYRVEHAALDKLMHGMGYNPHNRAHWIDAAAEASERHGLSYNPPTPGALYKMEYPGAQIEEFLRWDKPLKDQSNYVKRQLKRLGIDENKTPPHEMQVWDPQGNLYKFGDFTGEDLYSAIGQKYGQWAKQHQNMAPSEDPATAAVLRLNGIRGVRYPASEHHYPLGTAFNYSIFNPEALNVIKKYGMAGLMAGAGAAAGLNVGEAQAAGGRWNRGFTLAPVDFDPFEKEPSE